MKTNPFHVAAALSALLVMSATQILYSETGGVSSPATAPSANQGQTKNTPTNRDTKSPNTGSDTPINEPGRIPESLGAPNANNTNTGSFGSPISTAPIRTINDGMGAGSVGGSVADPTQSPRLPSRTSGAAPKRPAATK